MGSAAAAWGALRLLGERCGCLRSSGSNSQGPCRRRVTRGALGLLPRSRVVNRASKNEIAHARNIRVEEGK